MMAFRILAVKNEVLIRDVGETIQSHVSKLGYSVVRSYCGHGIGELFHCAPNVPHYARMYLFCTPPLLFSFI